MTQTDIIDPTETTPDAREQRSSDASAELTRLLGDLVSVSHRVTRLAAQASDSTQSPAVWRTLSVLYALGPVRLGELARQSRVTQPTMTKIVSNLHEIDWIERIADPVDGRAWQLAITPTGERELNAWRQQLAEALVPYFGDLDENEAEAMRLTVEVLRDRVAVAVIASKRDSE
ncbi:hypothetical protein GCM10027416_17650 [Okibacterium endophyticum]